LEADIESDIKLDNVIEAPESPEHQDMSAAPNVAGMIRPTQRSKKPVGNVLMTINTMVMRKIKGNKNK